MRKKKRNLIELVEIECKRCEKPTPHLYLGNFGVSWKPIYLYSCQECKNKYHSLVRMGEK